MDVVLVAAGADRAAALEILRDLTRLGRAEANGLLDNLPQPVVRGLSEAEARAVRRRFDEAGATALLR